MNAYQRLALSIQFAGALAAVAYAEPRPPLTLPAAQVQNLSRGQQARQWQQGGGLQNQLGSDYRGQGPNSTLPGMTAPAERRLGTPGMNGGSGSPYPTGVDGFQDPLAGRRSGGPRSRVVGPASLPSDSGNLVRKDSGDVIHFDDGGKVVIQSRDDGSSVRGVYDSAGNLQTVITVEPGADGNTVRSTSRDAGGGTVHREEHYDRDGNPIYDTRSVTRPGNRYQPDDSSSGGGGRGWHNPITGQSSAGAGLRVNGNLVRPSGQEAPPAPNSSAVQPGRHDLVSQPSPEATQGQRTPRQLDRNAGKIVNPGR